MATKRCKISELLTPEELLQQQREKSLADIETFSLSFIRQPTRSFQIGQEVYLGNRDCIVDEIFHEGKVYGLKCFANTKTDSSKNSDVSYFVEPWHNLRAKRVRKSCLAKNKNIQLSFSNRTIESLLHIYHSFGIDMYPEYQRGYVWTQADREYLLDSVFANADIGKFVFVHRENWKPGTPTYEILDGKQRLNTLVDFYEGRLVYQGYSFDDLDSVDRNFFMNHLVSSAEINNASQEEILRYFLFLNRGGREMDRSHLEKIEHMLETLK